MTFAGTWLQTTGVMVVVELAVMSAVAIALLAALGERVKIIVAERSED
jgi:hypothetical protein